MTKNNDFILLGDLHIGAGKHDEWTAENQWLFITQQLKPYMDQHQIKTIVQVGDFFDDRNAIRHKSHHLVNQIIEEMGWDVKWHILLGNHDMAMRDKVEPNALEEILELHDNVWVYTSPETADINGVKIDMIPWICNENREQIMEFVSLSDTDYCVGHFELKGFRYYPNQPASIGDDPGFLEKYEQVWTGHYHTPNSKGNIMYLGTPYTLNMNDAGDNRYFYHARVENGVVTDVEAIENPVIHHEKYTFDASTYDGDLERYENPERTKLWVVCENPTDKKKKVDFAKISEKLTKMFADVRVDYVQDLRITQQMAESVDMDDYKVENTSKVIQDTVDDLDIEDRREQIKEKLITLHRQAEIEANTV